MSVSTENKYAPKWQRALGIFVMLVGSTALCWLAVEVLTLTVGPIESFQRDPLLNDVFIFILWCFCFATVSESFHYWWEHRRWKS